MVAEADFNGARTEFVLDGAGRAVRVVDAVSGVRERRYGVCGEIVSESSSADGLCEFGYDGAGELVSVVNGDASVVFERDGLGRVVAESVNGVVVRSRFDVVGRRTDRVVESAGRSWSSSFVFDGVGELVAVVILRTCKS